MILSDEEKAIEDKMSKDILREFEEVYKKQQDLLDFLKPWEEELDKHFKNSYWDTWKILYIKEKK